MNTTENTLYIGFTCAYTPLPLIDAACYVPYRILPMGNSPDLAGQILHDNLCPHVKRVTPDVSGLKVAMSGGVARNHGVVRALNAALNLEVSIPPQPDTVGALGAALFARERGLL